jgi:gluconokinase
MLRAAFWPAKLRWLRRTDRAGSNRVARWISPVAWITRELFGVEATSHSMASGTGLYSLKAADWDEALCDACDVAPGQLGTICDLSALSKSRRSHLRSAAIFPAIGDGAASNLGSGADVANRVAINIGTSAAVRTVEAQSDARRTELPFGLFRYVVDDKRTLLGGAVSNAGNLRQWCLRELRLQDESAAEKALSRGAIASDHLSVLPFWVSERAPTWPEGLHGVIAGLAQTTTAADIFRAVTTSTYYRLADILAEIEKALGTAASDVVVSGGVLRSPASLKLLADCLGRDIHVSGQMESSLRGAAIHAIQQLGGTVAPLAAERLVRHNAVRAEQHRSGRERQRTAERMFSDRREMLPTRGG